MGIANKASSLPFLKAIFPLSNYDGEPSMSNGIAYQLPSSHLFIHRVPAKLSNRVLPYGVNYCQLQLSLMKTVSDISLPDAAGLLARAALPQDR